MEGNNRKSLRARLKALLDGIGTMNLVLVMVGAFFVWFNWQMLDMFRESGSIPETYACAVVSATIGELGICGWIRTNKDKHRDRKWELEDRNGENEEKKEKTDTDEGMEELGNE